jgi:hypothetical protein
MRYDPIFSSFGQHPSLAAGLSVDKVRASLGVLVAVKECSTVSDKPVIWLSVVDNEIHIFSKDPTTEESEKYEIALIPTGKRADVEAGILRNILEEAGVKVKFA